MGYWCSKYEPIEYNGKVKTAHEWAEFKGVAWETVKKRVQRGHGWKKALELDESDQSNKQPNSCRNKKTKRKSNSAWCYFTK